MAKILSKSGDSLADVYDVKGSIAGIDNLQSTDVNLVHEMGGTVFSERLFSQIVEIPAGAIAASTQFNVNFSFLRQHPRLLAFQVISSDATRLSRVQASITAPPGGDAIEVPIWAWDVTSGTSALQSILIGTGVTTVNLLQPLMPATMPNLFVRIDGGQDGAFTLSIRGTTNAFGAGTVTTTGLAYVAFPQLGGVSSRGLPLPSW